MRNHQPGLDSSHRTHLNPVTYHQNIMVKLALQKRLIQSAPFEADTPRDCLASVKLLHKWNLGTKMSRT